MGEGEREKLGMGEIMFIFDMKDGQRVVFHYILKGDDNLYHVTQTHSRVRKHTIHDEEFVSFDVLWHGGGAPKGSPSDALEALLCRAKDLKAELVSLEDVDSLESIRAYLGHAYGRLVYAERLDT